MAEILGLEIDRINHDCFKVKSSDKVVYFDPYKIKSGENADIVLIGHEHFDHCSTEDIAKVATKDTVILCNSNSVSKVGRVEAAEVVVMSPGKEVNVNGVNVKAVAAYNVNKFRSPGQPFHPKEDEHCGYIVTLDGKKVYHMGDTDVIPEMDSVECDIALVPVSGKYVMTADEAVEAVKKVNPKVAVPMHYGDIVGTDEDAKKFQQLVGDKVKII